MMLFQHLFHTSKPTQKNYRELSTIIKFYLIELTANQVNSD